MATLSFGELYAASGVAVAAFTEAADPHPVQASDDRSDFFQPWAETDASLLVNRVREKWARYVQENLHGHAFTVMDGQLFHGDLTNLFMMEMAADDLSEHICMLMNVIAPLQPIVIYLRPADLRAAIRKILVTRGPDWETYQLSWKLRSPFATHRQLTGVDGLTAMYMEYRALTDTLFNGLDCPKLAIDTSRGEWRQHYHQVSDALGKLDVRI